MAVTPSDGAIQHLIAGGLLYGGYSNETAVPDQYQVARAQYLKKLREQEWITREPVNLITGAYLYGRSDLRAGSLPAPLSLEFVRAYSSLNRLEDSSLGPGWTHNWNLTVTVDSNTFLAMGDAAAVDAAAVVAGLYAAIDLLSGTAAKERLLITTLIARWVLDQTIDNTVNVTLPDGALAFVRLADNTYNPPCRVSAQLTRNPDGSFEIHGSTGILYEFDPTGKMTSWSDPNGNTVSLAYSGGHLTGISNDAGRNLNLTWNGDRIETVDDGAGRTVQYSFSPEGYLVGVTDPASNTIGYGYDADGRLESVFLPEHPADPQVINTYDTLDRVREQRDEHGNLYTYYFGGNRTEELDPLGNSRVLYSNGRGRVVLARDPLGRETTYGYDGQDRKVEVRSPEGNAVTFAYDERHNLVQMTAVPKPGAAADPLAWSFTYASAANLMTSSTDPLGRVTTFAYDANGNLTRTELPMVDGNTPFVEYTRNGRGQPEQISRAEGLVTTMTYDAGTGDLAGAVTDPAGLALADSYTYDEVGNLTGHTDRRGGLWAYEWDSTRRLKTITDPLGYVTRYTYDADGNLLTVSKQTGDTRAPWQTTAFAYTLGGQRAGITGPRGEISTMDYDELGRLWHVTDPRGRVSELQYDALGRVSRRRGPLPGQEVEITYTPNGEVGTVADATGNGLTYAYDGFDRLERGTYADGSFEQYTYDKAGNRTREQNRAGSVIEMTHDSLDRLRTRTLPGGSVTTLTYDLNDRLVQVADPHGTYSQEFDAAGRLTVATSPGGKELRYGYDADGNVLSLTHPDGFIGFTYTYDNAYNQVSAACDNGALEYTSSPGTLHSTSNDLNQLVTANGRALSYDTNGNLISDEVNTYGFDVENLLRTVATPAHTATYEYDPFGRRRSKTVDGVIRSYAYDGPHAVAEYDGSGQVVRRTVYGPRIDEPVRFSGAAGTYYYHADHLGTIIALSDSNGELAETYAYSPFGRPARTSGVGNPVTYTGREYDEETGLYYYRARYYSPELSRFISPDPLGPASGDLNAYAYCLNNPVMYTDPSGRLVTAPIIYGIGILVAVGLVTLEVAEIKVPAGNQPVTAQTRGPLIYLADDYYTMHPAVQRSVIYHERQHQKWDWWLWALGKNVQRSEILAHRKQRHYLHTVERPRYEKKGATEALAAIDKEISDLNDLLANDAANLRLDYSPDSGPTWLLKKVGKFVLTPIARARPEELRFDSLNGWQKPMP